jgi:Subtilase family
MIRVADTSGEMTSASLLSALIVVLWPSARFDVVNISLSGNLGTPCSTAVGASLDYVIESCRRHNSGTLPIVVAAAGNYQDMEIAYPALMRDAIVAFALDRAGRRSLYNSYVRPALAVREVEAFGGAADDCFGLIRRNGGDERIFGTSFAAAVVSAGIVP